MKKSDHFMSIAFGVTAIVCLFFAVGVRNPESYKNFGPWGDFVGGVLNPILTCLTFGAVLYSLRLQRQDLIVSLEEMKRSGDALAEQSSAQRMELFNSYYFHLLDALDRYKESLKIRSQGFKNEPVEYEFFDSVMRSLNSTYRVALNKAFSENQDINKDDLHLSHLQSAIEITNTTYAHKINAYRKIIQRIVALANQSNDKDLYLQMLSVRMSDNEHLYLIYSNYALRMTGAGEQFSDAFLRSRFDGTATRLPPIS